MGTVLGLGAGALILSVVIWLLPILLILGSDKTSGREKLIWVLLIVFFTWFAWIFYVFLAPLEPRETQ